MILKSISVNYKKNSEDVLYPAIPNIYPKLELFLNNLFLICCVFMIVWDGVGGENAQCTCWRLEEDGLQGRVPPSTMCTPCTDLNCQA